MPEANAPSASDPPPTLSVLLVDDDVELAVMMGKFFASRGICLDAVHDGVRGLARAFGGGHDLILLDVMMPGLDGFELLRQVRRRSQVPVIMLTARTEQADRVAGLDAGADDYLPKPFGPEELLARVKAVLRRTSRSFNPEVLDAAGVSLDVSARTVKCEGNPVAVTSFEYDVLEYLIRSAGRVVSRAELTAVLYQRRASPFDRALDVHVHHLRKKLGRQGGVIRTVRGVGFLFSASDGQDVVEDD